MNDTRRFAFLAVAAMIAIVLPCVAQDQNNGQATPAVSGTGNAGHIAIWKNSTTLGSSTIYATGGNVGIGTTAPAAKLEVNGNAQVDGNFSLSGSILETGFGQLLWAGTSAGGDLSVGLGAMPSTTMGAANTAVGYSALAANTTGEQNTAVGVEALSSNTAGFDNAAFGYQALSSNVSGFNTATGFRALYTNTTGQDNTATGATALASNTTGYSNTANGRDALGGITAGYQNVGVGFGALVSITTGSGNVGVGFDAGTNLIGTSSNNIEIGTQGFASDNATIRIGAEGSNTSTFIAGIAIANVSGVPVLVSSTGQLGVASSSRRYKEDINDMADASDRLMKLRPVTFRYKRAYEDGSKPVQYGLIAEEVAEVYPDLVARSADGQVESVRYQLLDPMLLNELQKQHATIAAQKEQIHSLEERLARVEAMLAAGATGATGQ